MILRKRREAGEEGRGKRANKKEGGMSRRDSR
jgi:hypothetical protein